jgi:hypothetical protein
LRVGVGGRGLGITCVRMFMHDDVTPIDGWGGAK